MNSHHRSSGRPAPRPSSRTPAAPSARLPADSLAAALVDAARAVAAVTAGETLDDAFARMPDGLSDNGAAVRDLAYQCLRAHAGIDRRLAVLVPKPLREADRQALLRVALCRLEARPDGAHTTVSQAVDAARALGGDRFGGLMNAVLRNAQRRHAELDAAVAADEAARLQHPAWWLERLRADHPDDWAGIAAQGNSHPPMALRVNRRRSTLEAAEAALAAAGIGARGHGASGLLLDKPCPVSRLPGFAEGALSVQDLGAQQAAALLDVAAGQRVLDACAAPGGKACHLLEQADVDLLALDHSEARAQRIADNFARLGLPGRIAVGDAARPDDWWDGRLFDRILADVPCSASGVVRRHPDAKWLRRPKDIAQFASQQRAILDALWRVLAPGGKLLYATCSVFRAENQDQVAAFAARHPDCRRLTLSGAPDLSLLPTAEHDGFYYALLQKAADAA